MLLHRTLAGELQSLRAEVQRPIDGSDQRRRHRAHGGIAALAEAVGDQAGGGEYVAQVVVHLGDRGAQCRQARLLQQRRAQTLLHVDQLSLGDADLVAALGRRQRSGGIFRVGPEGGHALGNAPHWAHHQKVQTEIHQRGGEHRNDKGQRQNAPGIIEHLAA